MGLADLRADDTVRWTIAFVALAALLSPVRPAAAHETPYSFLEIALNPSELRGTLTAHVFDLAHERGSPVPDSLLDPSRAAAERDPLLRILGPRLQLVADGTRLDPHWGRLEVDTRRRALTFHFSAPWPRLPGVLEVRANLFPYDRQHQTYLNISEGDSLRLQEMLDHRRDRIRHFTGGNRGRSAVLGRFVASGIHHIFIGPDHILFVVGLMLLGGGIGRLLKIITAFTLAHSITLALATLRILEPPGRVVEPLIALSIVFVGIDNLLARPGRDRRVQLAFVFGLVHGFGFASVLRDFGLPAGAVGWSLFSFNLGVEIGQAAIVTLVAPVLGAFTTRSPTWGARVVRVGSGVVALAGAYWFGERIWASYF